MNDRRPKQFCGIYDAPSQIRRENDDLKKK